jgi:hypothetical protein
MARLITLLLPLLLLAGCGSGLVGDGVPTPTRATLFGHRTSGELVEGWLLVTAENLDCADIPGVLDGTTPAGDSLWILLEKGPDLDWVGLYPGTFGGYPGEDTAEGRHTEVYVHQGGDTAVLTGNDAWVQVFEYESLFKAELGTSLAEGLIVAEDCGER